MGIAEYNPTEVRGFRGAFTTPDRVNVPKNAALLAQNVEFIDGDVVTRTGFADTTVDPQQVVSSFANWLFTDPSAGPKNYLLFWCRSPYGGLKGTSLDSVSIQNVYTQAGAYGAVYAPFSQAMYVAHYGTDGLGKGDGRAVSLVSGNLTADACFKRPMLTTEVTVGVGLGAGGSLTPGSHRFAFILERRNGHIGRPGPAENTAALTLSPTTAAVTTNRTATVTITPAATWPADAVKVHLLMTTATNSARYIFVPDAKVAVTAGGAAPAVFTVSISDQDLASKGDEATRYINLLTTSNADAAPFNPVSVAVYGKRVAWFVNDTNYGSGVFFSEPNHPQNISAAKHLIQFPKGVVGGFELYGVFYVYGHNWLMSVQDNGNYPATWAQAKKIDQTAGSSSPHGAVADVARGTGWLASKSGLFRFSGGVVATNPVSEHQAEWDRINWAVPHAVCVCDDTANRRVHVLVPLDAATEPSHILTWDYSGGQGRENFSFDYIGLAGQMAFLSVVQNAGTKRLEVWMAMADAAKKFRRRMLDTEANCYQDGDTYIQSAYRTAPVLGGKGATMLTQHHGDILRVRGSGNLTFGVGTFDGSSTGLVAKTVALAAAPDRWPLVRYYALREDVTLYFANQALAGAYFRLSGFVHLTAPNAAQR